MKMGIIGYGGMAPWHNQIVSEIDGLEVGGVWDIKESARIRASNDGLYVYNNLSEMLSDDEISLILIATDNDVHASLAIEAMENGKHVVCEKPITLSCKLLDEMISVSQRTGMTLSVHQNRRWDKDYCTVKKLIEDEELGKVFRLESRVHGSRGISNTWRRIKEKGGGVIYDWGVHLFDQLLQIKKGVQIESVYATAHKVTTKNVEDGFLSIITFKDGFTALIEVETSDFVGCPRWMVFGESGTAKVESWDGVGKLVKRNTLNEPDTKPFITSSGYTKTMAPRDRDTTLSVEIKPVDSDITEFYKNVMASINKKQKPIITFTEMRNVIRLIEAVFESVEKNQCVNCDLIPDGYICPNNSKSQC